MIAPRRKSIEVVLRRMGVCVLALATVSVAGATLWLVIFVWLR